MWGVLRQSRLLVVVGLSIAVGGFAQTTPSSSLAQERAEQERLEKEGCCKNLKIIWEAIQAYRQKNKDLPNWLSDLVPNYLADADVLLCPISKRLGIIYSLGIPDPERRSSYHYEFCPRPVEVWGGSKRTMREWKRREMGLIGGSVPIVRCHFHRLTLNLGFDGQIYESTLDWEDKFTNVIDREALTPARLFEADSLKPAVGHKRDLGNLIPPREVTAAESLIDLAPFYNGALTEGWFNGKAGNDLSALPRGVQTLGGTAFDIRGLIQLSGLRTDTAGAEYPSQVADITVRQRWRRLHCLLGLTGEVVKDETQVASLVLHLANGFELIVPIVQGRQVRFWVSSANEPSSSKPEPVWTGQNTLSRGSGQSVRLYRASWDNPYPSEVLVSVDFRSQESGGAPFLVALTVDP